MRRVEPPLGASGRLTAGPAGGSQPVTFEFRPTVKGKHTYTVKVPPVAEEKIAENNQRSAVSLVVEAGIKVLYIEGTLRAEYGAWHAAAGALTAHLSHADRARVFGVSEANSGVEVHHDHLVARFGPWRVGVLKPLKAWPRKSNCILCNRLFWPRTPCSAVIVFRG